MRDSNPRRLAAISALLVSLCFVLVITASHLLGFAGFGAVLVLAGTAVIFVVSFILFHYILNHFIYNKIRLIYKTIHELKAPRGRRKEEMFKHGDIIRRANEEVMEWASDKKREIDDLKKMEAYRREFLGNVSHELKTPVFNIQGYVLTLLDGGLEDPGINREYLMRTEQSINRMISIIEDLETISKLESGEVRLKYSHFDLVDLACDVMEHLDMEAGKKNIDLVFGSSYESPVMVYADRKSIHQVLVNLVVNAIKYGSKNGSIKLSFFDMDENILTEVTDTGIGITREELPRIFERFYRGEKSRSRSQGGGGSGLGLAIVKHIIEAHNQTINVRSTPGVGSTFAFTLKKGKNIGSSYGLLF